MAISVAYVYLHPKPDAQLLIVISPLLQDNVLLDANFRAQIADFGLTRHSDATVTQSGALHYHFAAPELLGDWARAKEEDTSESDDDGQLTTRTQKSDVYAFGCLYYEVGNTGVLTWFPIWLCLDIEWIDVQIQFGVVPFEGVPVLQLATDVLGGKRPRPMDKPPLGDKAWKLIKRCWASEVIRRPAMENILERMMAWKSA